MARKVHETTAYRLGKRVFGKHGSGGDDLSTNGKSLVADYLDEKHHRQRRVADLSKKVSSRARN
jgi:hypothetical protein